MRAAVCGRALSCSSTRTLLQQFRWDVFDHPPYSPELAPSDFYLFTQMKVWLGTQSHFHTDEELMDGINGWLSPLAAEFFEEGIQKLVPRYDKCLNRMGVYVEK